MVNAAVFIISLLLALAVLLFTMMLLTVMFDLRPIHWLGWTWSNSVKQAYAEKVELHDSPWSGILDSDDEVDEDEYDEERQPPPMTSAPVEIGQGIMENTVAAATSAPKHTTVMRRAVAHKV